MTIKFNPHPSITAAAMSAQSAGISSLSGLMMAPVDLTPLAPPSSGPAIASLPGAPDKSIAAERRQAFFAGKQQALLNRLQQSPAPMQGSALSAAQRHACVAVLAAVAARVNAHVGE